MELTSLLVPALGIAIIALAIGLIHGRLTILKLAVRAAEAEKALKDLKSAPRQIEHRIERFDLLWFPSLTVLEQSAQILAVNAGLPHCRACVSALKLQNGPQGEAWLCLDCGARHPHSLADAMVTDAVTQQAVKEFCQRNKGYRLAAKP